jgi:hypothetical protein
MDNIIDHDLFIVFNSKFAGDGAGAPINQRRRRRREANFAAIASHRHVLPILSESIEIN